MLTFWRWERFGGLSTLVAGIALGISAYVTALGNNAMAALTMNLPIVAIGSMFLFVSSTRPTPKPTASG